MAEVMLKFVSLIFECIECFIFYLPANPSSLHELHDILFRNLKTCDPAKVSIVFAAATLISKAPNLYGFRDLVWDEPLEHDFTYAPGGTAMAELADHLQVTRQYMKEINPELLLGYIPQEIEGHFIRVPKGSARQCEQFFRKSVALN